MIQQSYSWLYIQKKNKSPIQKDTCTPSLVQHYLQ